MSCVEIYLKSEVMPNLFGIPPAEYKHDSGIVLRDLNKFRMTITKKPRFAEAFLW